MVRQPSHNWNLANSKKYLTQNYEKNVGIFDMINLEKDKSTEANWMKKILVSFTFMDNEIEKVIAIF